jgi:hypothetical protein
VLGYQDFNDRGQWTVDVEMQIGAGSVALAFGRFTGSERRIIAPFELKGAKTKNMDTVMPGRAKWSLLAGGQCVKRRGPLRQAVAAAG